MIDVRELHKTADRESFNLLIEGRRDRRFFKKFVAATTTETLDLKNVVMTFFKDCGRIEYRFSGPTQPLRHIRRVATVGIVAPVDFDVWYGDPRNDTDRSKINYKEDRAFYTGSYRGLFTRSRYDDRARYDGVTITRSIYDKGMFHVDGAWNNVSSFVHWHRYHECWF